MSAYQLTTAWQKVASAGDTVEVQNLSLAPAIIARSSSGPPAALDGIVLFGSHGDVEYILTQDLYARCTAGIVILEVMGGFSLSSGTASSTSATTPTATTTASAAGGGPNNTADFSDPNNAYLVSLWMTA